MHWSYVFPALTRQYATQPKFVFFPKPPLILYTDMLHAFPQARCQQMPFFNDKNTYIKIQQYSSNERYAQ